ncbi:MAG TPA: ATP-binding protein [Methylibium sp.]|nr:ATP-binding protein [Methylibium sp.]
MSSLPDRSPARAALDAPITQSPTLPPDAADSGADADPRDDRSDALGGSHGLAWRLRLLVLLALAGCVGLFLLTRGLAAQPGIDASWRANAQGQLELAASRDPALAPFAGRVLLGVIGGDSRVAVLDAVALQRSPRWLLHDGERAHHRELHARLAAALAQPRLRLYFADGGTADLNPAPRGVLSLGLLYALLAALALVLYLLAMVVMLVRPSLRNGLYGAMALAQCGNLVFIAASTAFDLALPPLYARWELPLRTAFDLLTGAAILHASCVHPRRLPQALPIALAGWAGAGVLLALIARDALPGAWWWTQGSSIAYGLLAIALLSWSYRIEPHPYALLLRRFGIITVGTLVLLTLAVAAVSREPGVQQNVATVGSMIWVVFLASLLLLVPFLSRSQQLLREFSLLAGLSTVATSLDLLFVTAFSLGQFTSITLSIFLSLGLYAGVRQWVLNQMRADNMVSTERLFERLYRMAREVERHPDRASASLLALLRDLFEPLEAVVAPQASSQARASGDGSTLMVPVPDLKAPGGRGEQTLMLRFAQRGRRLFNREDARLADRIVEQLKRAVQFDQAVERGRREERSRIAQDLHDDIGARLLTMMYQAQSPEHEDYIRHTLQDLKTLTRGLAAPNHTLIDASGEWKADLQQRLQLAHIALEWHTRLDRDAELSVVQWSALTRVLRELASNTIAHSQATRVAVSLRLVDDRLEIVVRDDGVGRNPQAWAHGLGLGGVRKRVKQLGGEVQWREAPEGGIECRVSVAGWSQAGSG